MEENEESWGLTRQSRHRHALPAADFKDALFTSNVFN